MSDKERSNEESDGDSRSETERIRKWREERARVAEEEKRERLAQADQDKQKRIAAAREERERQVQAEEIARKEAARKLLPSQDSIEHARQRLKARARKKKNALLWQLALFVVIPTLVVLTYMKLVATPLYETQSVLVVTKPGSSNSENLGGLLSSFSGGANPDETFQAHEFIQSKALMNRLEREAGVVSLLSGETIDPLRRLRHVTALGLTKHDLFSNFVNSSVNIQTGLITLYVYAPTPQASAEIAQRTIDATTEHINILAEELFSERLTQARASVADAREKLRSAQSDLTRLQIESGEIDPRARVEGVLAAIEKLTLDAQNLRAEIEQAEVAGYSDSTQVRQLREREELLKNRMDEQRERLVHAVPGDQRSLNELLVKYELALLEVRIAEESLTTSIQSAQQAEKEAALGRNFFQVVVPPIPSEHAKHPNVTRLGLLTVLIMLSAFSVAKLLFFRF